MRDFACWRYHGNSLSRLCCLGAVLCAIAFPLTAAAADECGGAPAKRNHDCARHGMLVVGKEAIFLSHLPMFSRKTSHSPHRYQVILEVGFDNDGVSLDQDYLRDRENHPDIRMYTLNPTEDFVLSRLFEADEQGRQREEFQATVFQGHFERESPRAINGLTGANVRVKRVVYARELPLGSTRPKQLEYFLFGHRSDLYLAHQITRAPDFDQIVAVEVSGHEFTESELSRGVTLTVLGRADSAAKRLKSGEKISAQGHVTGAHQFLDLELTLGTEYYFEQGELRTTPTFDSTPLEKAAGF